MLAGTVQQCGAVVVVYYVVMRKWSEVLQRWMMWCGFVDNKLWGGV